MAIHLVNSCWLVLVGVVNAYQGGAWLVGVVGGCCLLFQSVIRGAHSGGLFTAEPVPIGKPYI